MALRSTFEKIPGIEFIDPWAQLEKITFTQDVNDFFRWRSLLEQFDGVCHLISFLQPFGRGLESLGFQVRNEINESK